jgi:aspartate aminotransferase
VFDSGKLSARAARIKPSATFMMAARAGALRATGTRVFDFSAGEPDFAAPAAIREAVAAYVRDNAIGYTPVAGMPALREAIARELSAVHGTAITPARVLVSCGAKHSIVNLFLATLDPGDEVVVPAPYWVSYPEMVRVAGAEPVIVQSTREDGWRLRPDALAAAVGPRTRYVVLNSPSNPTGAGYGLAEIRALGEVLARHAPDAVVLADDIYRQLAYAPFEHASVVKALAGVHERWVLVDGVSKTYAMTGYRIGYLVAPENVTVAATRIQGQMTSNAATPSQYAALVALTDATVPGDVANMRSAFRRRRDTMVECLRRVPDLGVTPPDGAFYVFVDARAYLGGAGRPADDDELASLLVERYGVATVPGAAFGAPGHIRLSYATDDASIVEGCARIGEAFHDLSAGP